MLQYHAYDKGLIILSDPVLVRKPFENNIWPKSWKKTLKFIKVAIVKQLISKN